MMQSAWLTQLLGSRAGLRAAVLELRLFVGASSFGETPRTKRHWIPE